MKLLAPLAAAAMLAASLPAAPAFAHDSALEHQHLSPGRVIYKNSRYINRPFESDPNILYPIIKPRLPIPVPGPCLSCPPFDLNPNEIANPLPR